MNIVTIMIIIFLGGGVVSYLKGGKEDMTKKRFTYENHKVKDNKTGEVHSSNMVSVNVLNALNDENEQLKKLFFEMLIQTNVEIDPKKPTRYSATLIFNAEQYLTVKKIIKDFKR